VRHQTLSQIASRYTVLINETNRHPPGRYPIVLRLQVLGFIHETERWLVLDPHERDLLAAARTLGEAGDPKGALFALHELLNARLR
jgi:hypothetical protein